jgi:hypothetical protein
MLALTKNLFDFEKARLRLPEASSELLGNLLVFISISLLIISLLILVGSRPTLARLTTRVLLGPTLTLLPLVPFALGVLLRVFLGRILLSRLLTLLLVVIHF